MNVELAKSELEKIKPQATDAWNAYRAASQKAAEAQVVWMKLNNRQNELEAFIKLSEEKS